MIAFGWLAIRDHHAADWARFPGQLLNGPVFYHLWYVYVLMGLYLVLPLLRPLAAQPSESLRRYALGLWALASALVPLWHWWGGMHIGIDVPVVTTYVGYLLAGIWLAALPVSLRTRRTLGVLTLLTATWTITASARLTGTDPLNVALFAYGTPNVLVMSVGWFVLLTQPGPAAWVARHAGVLAVVRSLATTSYGVYLVHPLLLNLLDSGVLGFRFTGASIYAPIGIPLLAGAVVAVSAGLMLVAGRIPVIGRLLGAR